MHCNACIPHSLHPSNALLLVPDNLDAQEASHVAAAHTNVEQPEQHPVVLALQPFAAPPMLVAVHIVAEQPCAPNALLPLQLHVSEQPQQQVLPSQLQIEPFAAVYARFQQLHGPLAQFFAVQQFPVPYGLSQLPSHDIYCQY